MYRESGTHSKITLKGKKNFYMNSFFSFEDFDAPEHTHPTI